MPRREENRATQVRRTLGRWTVALLLGVTTLLSGGCGGETDVNVHFAGFVCTPTLPVMKSMSVHIGERIQRPGLEVLQSLGPAECINRQAPMSASAVSGFFAERGFVVQEVPADKETRLVVLLHVDPGCGQATPVCLLGDPIASGGQAQEIFVRGICAPAAGPGDPVWQLCTSVRIPQ